MRINCSLGSTSNELGLLADLAMDQWIMGACDTLTRDPLTNQISRTISITFGILDLQNNESLV